MRDRSSPRDSVRTADSAVAIENFSVKNKGRIEEPASFETKMKHMEVAAYPHFPSDNIAEVWLNIFDKLEADDKITFSKTCHEWNNWVASRRAYFLFSEILFPVVHMLKQTTNLRKRELLRCRTMCRSWTNDFDRVYPAHPSHLFLENEIDGVEEYEIIKLENHFTSTQRIQRFLEEMHSHPGNPFPGRSIRFQYESPTLEMQGQRRAGILRLMREYYALVSQLLEKYGSHLHMANFDIYPYGSWMEFMETYNYFRHWLLHIPNLKKLVVVEDNCHNSLSDEFFRQNTLPQLPHLETVWIDSTSHAIWNGVLEACVPSNVKRLYLLSSLGAMKHLRIPEIAYFPNLEAFEVRLSGKYLERFLNNLDAAPIPLVRTATVDCWEYELDFGRMFRSLEAFAGSLTDLTVWAYFTEDSLRDAIETEIDIHLPKLERLKLMYYYGPLDPFCKLPALKFLSILYDGFQQWEESSVDFCGFEGRMEESNIWEMIPSLQELHIQSNDLNHAGKSYHREKLQLSPSE
ncbi:unnamed protein product [Orchesella dallaii]|uniref:F-box domain-containing protein n=1 Tax=Orchesella dallaii TaxID=48710 RepID=A0ABP1R9F0_9HEXA